MKPDNFTFLLEPVRLSWLIYSVLDSNQDMTSSSMQRVTPPTQLSASPSQTSTVTELPSAHSDGVELWSSKSTQLSCQCVLRHYPVSGIPDSENPYPVHH